MKKRDVIKQKNKLKNRAAIKWIRYASYVSIGVVVLLLMLVGIMMMINQVSFQKMVESNPFIALSFTVAIENLFVWYILRRVIENMQKLQYIETAKVTICCVALVEIIMMNFVTGVLLIIALVKCFDYSLFSFSSTWQQVKKDKQIKYLVGIISVQVIMAYLFLLMSFLLYNLK